MITAVHSTPEPDDRQPINLRDRFGRRYQVGYGESYYAEHGRHARVDDPWLQVLFCRHGHLLPWSSNRLAASTDRRGAVASKLATLPCCRVEADGDDGITVSFDIRDFRLVAKVIKPRGRRRLSPVQLERFLEAGRLARFQPSDPGQDSISEPHDASSTPRGSNDPPSDSNAN